MQIKQVVLALAVPLFLTGNAGAQVKQRDTLRGLVGFYVTVGAIEDTEARHRGITQEQLQTDVELALRREHIRVLSISEARDDVRKPLLQVEVSAGSASETNRCKGIYAWSVRVHVLQEVDLKTSPSTRQLVPTWIGFTYGSTGIDSLGSIRTEVADLIKGLINDYLAANER